jgi:modulator of FtsH protease
MSEEAMEDKSLMNGGFSKAEPVVEINKVLKNTYMLLGMTLLFSAVAAGVSIAVGLSQGAALIMTLAAFGSLFAVHKTADSGTGLIWTFVFTGLMGASLGPMLNYYLSVSPDLVVQALGGTAFIFFALSGYALVSRKDFSFMGGFLFVGLLVILLAGIANIFFQIPAVHIAISAAGVMVGSGLILFDTSRIIHGGESNYIRATVALYMDIYYVFVHLLSLLGIMDD